jgi:WD40 repeat protein
VTIRNATTGQQLRKIEGHKDMVLSIAFDTVGQSLITVYRDGSVCSWGTDTDTRPIPLGVHDKVSVLSAAFGPNVSVALAGADKAVRVRDVRTGRLRHILWGHENSISSMSLSADGKLALVDDNGAVRVWDPMVRPPLHPLGLACDEHRGRNTAGAIAFSHDGKLLASPYVQKDGRAAVGVFDTATGKLLHTLTVATRTLESYDDMNSVAFSPDGKLLACGHRDGVDVWNPATDGPPIRTLGASVGAPAVLSVAFSRDGKFLAAGRGARVDGPVDGGSVLIWEATTGQPLYALGHGCAWSVAFSPDNEWLASGHGDGSVCVWDLHTGHLRNTLDGHITDVYCVVFSPDGKWLVSGGRDGSVRFWDTASWKPCRQLAGYKHSVWSVAFNHDGTRLVSADDDGSVRIWDTANGQPLHTLRGGLKGAWIRNVVFSPDGRLLASPKYVEWIVRLGWQSVTLARESLPTAALEGVQAAELIAHRSPDAQASIRAVLARIEE